MTRRSWLLGVGGIVTCLAVAFGGFPAVAGHNDDTHSNNAKKLERAPIRIDSQREEAENRARGSDVAFQGNLMVAGSYEGTGFFRMRRRDPLKQVAFHDCPGSQGDVSIWKDAVFVSIDSPSSNSVKTRKCNNTGTTGPGGASSNSSLGKEGIRVLDISDRRNPRQVGFVETVCGSHTHTLVPGGEWVYMYVQSYPLGAPSGECNQVTFRQFSILRFPKSDPTQLEFFGTGPIPNAFDDPLPPHLPTIGCHDSTSYPAKNIAVSACISNSMILDTTDPGDPQILSVIDNPSIEVHHTTAITWDGDYAIVSDEHAGAAGGGGCEGGKDGLVGEMWFYNITNRATPFTQPSWHYQLPRQPQPSTPEEAARYRCTTHNYNILPTKNRKKYVAVSAYYAGGWSMVDFSDPANPKEIAHYLPRVKGALPDMWSTYWYNGRIYSNEHATRFGVSAFKAKTGFRSFFFGGRLNPQTQVGVARDVVSSGQCQGFKRDSTSNRRGSGKVIVGSAGSDVLDGSPGDDIICGLGGDDIIDGNGGRDDILGQAGQDTITGGGGKDKVRGGGGRDSIDGRRGNDVLWGGSGADALRGNAQWDTLRGEGGRDTLQGGYGNDILRGGARGDTLKGFRGADLLNGDAGTDTCRGGPGKDSESNCER